MKICSFFFLRLCIKLVVNKPSHLTSSYPFIFYVTHSGGFRVLFLLCIESVLNKLLQFTHDLSVYLSMFIVAEYFAFHPIYYLEGELIML